MKDDKKDDKASGFARAAKAALRSDVSMPVMTIHHREFGSKPEVASEDDA